MRRTQHDHVHGDGSAQAQSFFATFPLPKHVERQESSTCAIAKPSCCVQMTSVLQRHTCCKPASKAEMLARQPCIALCWDASEPVAR